MAAEFEVVSDVKIEGRNGSLIQIYKNAQCMEYAGKMIDRSIYRNYTNEIEVLKLIVGECPNVVKFFTTITPRGTNPSPVILMELCDCNLKQYVKNDSTFIALNNRTMPPMPPMQYFADAKKISLAKQMCEALEFLHKQNIIHGVIAPKNILLKRQGDITVVKISSYGFSKHLPENVSGTFYSLECEKEGFTAPEFSTSEKVRKSVDIFSLGLVLFYLFSDGKHVFGKGPTKWQHKIDNKKDPSFSNVREKSACFEKYKLTREQAVCAVDLIRKMVRSDHASRYSIQEALHHPVFWSAKKKIKFYEELHKFLSNNQSKHFDGLDEYRQDLLTEGGKRNSFSVLLANLPFSIENAYPKSGAKECNNVKNLIRLIRNLAQHVTHKSTHIEIKKCLGVNVDGTAYDADVFLEKLTSNYPQLLAHLYEFFRDKNIQGNFYPRQVGDNRVRTPVASPRHQVPTENTPVPAVELPDEVKAFLKQHQIEEEDLFKCDLEIFRCGVSVVSRNVDLRLPLTISGPNYSPNSNLPHIEIPGNKLLPNVQGILEDLNQGLILSRSGCDLVARRDGLTRIFCPEKMEQNKEITFFSLASVLANPAFKVPAHKFKFTIGTDPSRKDLPVPAFEVVLKPLVVSKLSEIAIANELHHSDVQKSV